MSGHAREEGRTVRHTPGPWTVELEEYELGSGTIIIPEINRTLHDPEWATEDEWDKDLANAHLIAAAPDLYAALVLAKAHLLGIGGFSPSVLARIEKAIAKAEGEAL